MISGRKVRMSGTDDYATLTHFGTERSAPSVFEPFRSSTLNGSAPRCDPSKIPLAPPGGTETSGPNTNSTMKTGDSFMNRLVRMAAIAATTLGLVCVAGVYL